MINVHLCYLFDYKMKKVKQNILLKAKCSNDKLR